MVFDFETLHIGTLKACVTDSWLSLSQAGRRRHMYVIGQTGSGKSTLLNNCILQDIMRVRRFVFIDRHDDCAESLVDSIPKWRTRDVVYLNPFDIEFFARSIRINRHDYGLFV